MNCRRMGCQGSMKMYVNALGLFTYHCDTCEYTETVQKIF